MSDASSFRVTSDVSTVAIDRPPRRTVTRSATSITSWSLCVMMTTEWPSAACCLYHRASSSICPVPGRSTLWLLSRFAITCDVKMLPSVESSQPGTKTGMFISCAASTQECSGGIW